MKVQRPYQRNKNPNNVRLPDESAEKAVRFYHRNLKFCVPGVHKFVVLWFRLPTEINVNTPSLPSKDSRLGF